MFKFLTMFILLISFSNVYSVEVRDSKEIKDKDIPIIICKNSSLTLNEASLYLNNKKLTPLKSTVGGIELDKYVIKSCIVYVYPRR